MDRPRGDRGKCFSGPDGSKSGPRGVQERPIRPWKPPLGRPSLFKGSKRPPRALQVASRAHLAAILAPCLINFEASSMRCCPCFSHVSSLKAPSPRALDPRPKAWRNARERLNKDASQNPHGGMPAPYLPTVTDVLTEISREPHIILPESSYHNTESLLDLYRLLPATCQEPFAL